MYLYIKTMLQLKYINYVATIVITRCYNKDRWRRLPPVSSRGTGASVEKVLADCLAWLY